MQEDLKPVQQLEAMLNRYQLAPQYKDSKQYESEVAELHSLYKQACEGLHEVEQLYYAKQRRLESMKSSISQKVYVISLLNDVASSQYSLSLEKLPPGVEQLDFDQYIEKHTHFLSILTGRQLVSDTRAQLSPSVSLATKQLTYKLYEQLWKYRRDCAASIRASFEPFKLEQVQSTDRLAGQLQALNSQLFGDSTVLPALVQRLQQRITELNEKSQGPQYEDLKVSNDMVALLENQEQVDGDSIQHALSQVQTTLSTVQDLCSEYGKLGQFVCQFAKTINQKLVADEISQIQIRASNNTELAGFADLAAQVCKVVASKDEDQACEILGRLMELDEMKGSAQHSVSLSGSYAEYGQMMKNLAPLSSVEALCEYRDQLEASMEHYSDMARGISQNAATMLVHIQDLGAQISRINVHAMQYDVHALSRRVLRSTFASGILSMEAKIRTRCANERFTLTAPSNSDVIKTIITQNRRKIQNKYQVALSMICPVCLSRQIQTVFDCGHFYCRQCAKAFMELSERKKNCYICQQTVRQFYDLCKVSHSGKEK